MENVIKRYWRSKDFYLSSIIRASGVSLLELENTGHDFVVFVFDISPEKAEETILLHWSRKLNLPTRDLIDAINELRTRLKNKI